MRFISNRSMRCLFILLLWYSLASSVCVAAEVPELVTDRPDQTESSVTVPYRSVQIETGWLHSVDDDEDIETDAFPQTLLRYGLAERLELRFGYAGYFWEDNDGPGPGNKDETGSGDTAIGFKIKFWDEEGYVPETALISHVSLPTGESPFSSERFDPDYRFAFTNTLSERLSLTYNLGQAWRSEEDETGDRDTKSYFQYTAALGMSLTDKLGCFVEFFGDIPTSSSMSPANSFDGGFTYLVTDDLQLDLFSGLGLSDEADDWFIGAGLSIRFR